MTKNTPPAPGAPASINDPASLAAAITAALQAIDPAANTAGNISATRIPTTSIDDMVTAIVVTLHTIGMVGSLEQANIHAANDDLPLDEELERMRLVEEDRWAAHRRVPTEEESQPLDKVSLDNSHNNNSNNAENRGDEPTNVLVLYVDDNYENKDKEDALSYVTEFSGNTQSITVHDTASIIAPPADPASTIVPATAPAAVSITTPVAVNVAAPAAVNVAGTPAAVNIAAAPAIVNVAAPAAVNVTGTPAVANNLAASSSTSTGVQAGTQHGSGVLNGFVCAGCNTYNLIRPSSDNWYAVTKGKAVGVFQGWHATSPLVIGVKSACFKKYPTEDAANIAFNMALISGNIAVLE